MYKVSVPLMNSNVKRSNRNLLLEELKKFDCKRVFLALNKYEIDDDKRQEMISELKDNCAFFKQNGYEVGAWIWAFQLKNNTKFTNMRSILGAEIKETMCPTDKEFVNFAVEYIKDIAKCKVDIIQFDDDFRYGFHSDSAACLCDNHIAKINRITGSHLTREEIKDFIINDSPNKYRDAYLKVNGEAFINFASEIRKGVDSIDPGIRVGACACMTSWDIDGTDAYSLAKVLAGNTKPFVRLIGAPYWAVNKNWGNMLQDVVELERMESSWTKKEDIEIMAEGDVFPRPRTLCPAGYLEGFDTAIRAAGCTDGILKYGIDYTSDVDYETGYAKFHQRNKDTYKMIDKYFSHKKHIGVRVYESMKKVPDMVMPTKVNKEVEILNLFFSKAARTLSYNTIPTVYEGDGICGIVFDENARKLPLEALKNGMIIDIAAAEILMERGVDVGIRNIGEETCGKEEHFVDNDNHISMYTAKVYHLDLKDGAEVLSDTEAVGGKVPVSFRYENADGNRFLVLNINTRTGNDSILKHYARSRQYSEQIRWLSGKGLPAYVYGNPSMYMQCKCDDNSMTVGLWNFCIDIAIEPVVELDKEYSEIEFINCNGCLEGDRVYLEDIPAFAFAAFEVR